MAKEDKKEAKDPTFQIIRCTDGSVVKVGGGKRARFEQDGSVKVYADDEYTGKPVREWKHGEVMSVSAPVTPKVAEEI